MGDVGAKALAKLTTITALNLNNNNVGDIGAEAFLSNKSLISLELAANKIGSRGAIALAQTALKYLNISSNNVGDECTEAFARNKTLQVLNLNLQNVGTKGVIALAESTTLASLNLEENKIDSDALNAFASNLSVVNLNMANNKYNTNSSLFNIGANDNPLDEQIKKRIQNNRTYALALINYCKIDDMDNVENCLKQNVLPYGPYVEEILGVNDTLPKLAIRLKNYALADLLIKHGAKINSLADEKAGILLQLPVSATLLTEQSHTAAGSSSQGQSSRSAVSHNPFAAQTPQHESQHNPFVVQTTSRTSVENTSAFTSLNNETEKLSLSSSLTVPYSALKFGERLGEGAFGVVFKATHGYETVAVKQLLIEKKDQAAVQSFISEAQHMMQLHSDYTVRLKGVCNEPYCLILEFMAGGSLFAYLKGKEPTAMMWLDRIKIALDMSYGLAYLHGKDIIHRDLKSLNVLLDDRGRAKLSDFGLTTTKAESSSAAKTKSACGTTAWMAPELLDPDKDESEYNNQTDIFAYAMVLYELASHKVPFQELKEGQISGKILNNKRPEMPESTLAAYNSLVIRCWDQTPGLRPAIDVAITELSNLKQLEETKNVTPQYPSMFTKT